MGMTASEKIIARASGRQAVRPGDVVYPDPDVIVIHDGLVAPARRELDALGIDRIATPDKVLMVSDHEVLYTSLKGAEVGTLIRQTARDWGVTRFYDVGRGGHGHIFPAERGLILPGMFVFDNDRHCTNHGSVGAFAMRVGTEISRVLATGTNWIQVPETVRLTLTGSMQPGVYPRDVGFRIARGLKPGGFFGVDIDYRVLEYAGPGLEALSWDARVALCNSPTEVRACMVYVPPSAALLAEIDKVATRAYQAVYSDPDASFAADLALDMSSVVPQVALTGSAGNGVDVTEVAGKRIDHAFIGSCGSSKWADMEIAAKVLKGRRIADRLRLFVVPGSEDTNRRMLREGLTEIFQDAGAILLPPGCGPCNGGYMGQVHAGEVSLSTAAGNEPGRMGHKGAEYLLASPATVAASAIAGEVVDPRNVAAVMADDRKAVA